MMQCRLCGCKFDETQVAPCTCSCAFGGCHGDNVRCPNCGYDMPVPKESKKDTESASILGRLKKSLKQEN